jgi:hypothetical protein
MGKLSSTAPDTASLIVAGTFSATGASTPAVVRGEFNVSLWGTFAGAVQLERSFDGGTGWIACALNREALPVYFAGGGGPVSYRWREIEPDVLYRMNATAITSGTANYRLSQ